MTDETPTPDGDELELTPPDPEPADELETEPDGDADELDDGTTPDPDDEGTPGDDQHVARLRREAGRYRRRARDAEHRADELARELYSARVAALGELADPADLPYDPELLDDPDGLAGAVAELLDERPHLRSRRIRQRIGQGEGSPSGGSILTGRLIAGT